LNNGKRNRRKGHQFERDIAIQLREIGYPNAKRHLEYQEGEANGIDISGVPGFAIQCKNKQKYVSVNTIKEIQVEGFDIPIVISKAKREEPMAIMRWEDLMIMMSILKETEGHINKTFEERKSDREKKYNSID